MKAEKEVNAGQQLVYLTYVGKVFHTGCLFPNEIRLNSVSGTGITNNTAVFSFVSLFLVFALNVGRTEVLQGF